MYRQIKGVEPMFDCNVPHPKYDLNRYATPQLYKWLEESVLIAEQRYKENVNTYPLPESEWRVIMAARRMKRAIWNVLRSRDEPIAKVARTMRLVKEDVNS
jgi:hypothetical protein